MQSSIVLLADFDKRFEGIKAVKNYEISAPLLLLNYSSVGSIA
jgi:hypothetical protein